MSNDEYQIDHYDQDQNGEWFATVIHIKGNRPVWVYRVPSSPPILSAQSKEQGEK